MDAYLEKDFLLYLPKISLNKRIKPDFQLALLFMRSIKLITYYGFSMTRLLLILSLTFTLSASASEIDLEKFAQRYFKTMVATQEPNATKVDLENYLSLLTDDIGHSHLPWVTDDSRLPDGKEAMRKGMMFYLAAHSEYSAELLNVFIFNNSAVAIRYKNSAKGIHPESKQPIAYTQTMMEVLEMENGKVAVIRKYHE